MSCIASSRPNFIVRWWQSVKRVVTWTGAPTITSASSEHSTAVERCSRTCDLKLRLMSSFFVDTKLCLYSNRLRSSWSIRVILQEAMCGLCCWRLIFEVGHTIITPSAVKGAHYLSDIVYILLLQVSIVADVQGTSRLCPINLPQYTFNTDLNHSGCFVLSSMQALVFYDGRSHVPSSSSFWLFLAKKGWNLFWVAI